MKTAYFPGIGVLNTTLPTPGDPTYQTEALALSLHEILKSMSDNGFQFNVAEPSDIAASIGDFEAYAETFSTWLGDAATASTSGLPVPVAPALPSLVALIPALLSGGITAIAPVLVNLALEIGVKWFYNWLSPDSDMNELKSVLEGISAKLENSNGDVLGDIIEKAWIDENAVGERYAILWNLARQAIRVIVHLGSQLDDVVFDDEP